MLRKKRRGSTLLLTMIVMMVTFTMGSAYLGLATQSMLRGRNDLLRLEATNLAEAGVEKAVYYIRGTAPNGSTDGSWRTDNQGVTETISGEGSYTIYVTSGAGANAGKMVVEAVGTASIGARTVRRRVRAVVERLDEDVSIWNNTIFGGVGQGGRSIQGNVVMRGGIHLLGDGESYTDLDHDGRWDNNETYVDTNLNGQYDAGEPFVDTDGDGHRDAREPFVDTNGNGTRDAPLTITDLAEDISGTANVGNNYTGMPADMLAKLPALPTKTVNGETVQTLSAKLRVKHGRVNISGSATVGDPNASGGSPPVKETMDGVYVNDGFGGTSGTANVYSDNGTSKQYDLGDILKFPSLTDPITVNGVDYASHQEYLSAVGLHVSGGLTITPGVAGPSISDAYGNSLTVDAAGNITITGIVYVSGNIDINRGSGGYGNTPLVYNGKGTLFATGNINVHTNVVSRGTFPSTDAMGFVAAHDLNLAMGGGDSQLELMGAFYAQYQVTSAKQNNIAGTFVSSYFSMTNVPHMYQVPALDGNLPPGMPGAEHIVVTRTAVDSWRASAP